MSRIRVLDLAKEINLETKVVLAKLVELGISVKNHFSAVSDLEADKLRTYVRKGRSPEKEKSASQSRVVIRRKVNESPESAQEFGALNPDNPSGGDIEQATHAEKETVEQVNLGNSSETLQNVGTEAAESPKPLESGRTSINETTPGLSHENVALLQASLEKKASLEKPAESENMKKDLTPTLAPSADISIPAVSAVVDQVPLNDTSVSAASTAKTSTSSGGATILSRSAPNPQPAKSGGAVIIRQAPPPGATPASTSTNRSVIIKRGETSPSAGTGSGTLGGQNRIIANRPAGSSPFPTGRTVADTNRSSNAYHSTSSFGSSSGQGRSDGIQMRQGTATRDGAPGAGPRTGGFPSREGGFPSREGGFPSRDGTARPGGIGGSGPGNRFGAPGVGGSRPGPGGGPSAFLATETTTTVGKEVTNRREREKEVLKRRQTEEIENRVKQARAKGKHGSEELEAGEVELLEGEILGDGQEEAAPTVRTVIPNRKRVGFRITKKEKRNEVANPTKASKMIIKVDQSITVADLAALLALKSSVVVKSLMKLGVLATLNQTLDMETATLVAQEFGFEVQDSTVSIDDILSKKKTEVHEGGEHILRPPVVTIMGHVDHGKTSLLDAIRSANVASKEAGGITQHIGAYQVQHNGHQITFLDTPGHEAFTSMRARGAQVTDVVILVVAADDGVMPQTVEAINHAKAAGVPIVVAVNKMDKPGVTLEKVQRELVQHQILAEDWGGDNMFVPVSAKTRLGIDQLLEAVLLQAEVLDLKATSTGLAQGIVIETRLDKSKGPIASVIVLQGTLKISDVIVAGTAFGRVRAMFDDKGERVLVAGPSTPVEIIGLNELPASGDVFNCVVNEGIAKEAAGFRVEKLKQKESAGFTRASLADLLAKKPEGEVSQLDLPIVLKADTHGSVEAIKSAVLKLQSPKIKGKFIHSGVGAISETDVVLAGASNALIIGFNVRPDKSAAEFADREKIDVKVYSIIYELIDAVQAVMVGRLAPVRSEKIQGHAEVRSLFSVPKIGVIAGSAVSDGIFTRNSHVRVLRDGLVLYTGRIGSLKRFKDDVKEVREGFECGIGVENYNGLKTGDVLESFIIEESAATL